MGPLPASPSSSSSWQLLHSRSSSKLNVVVQRNVKSSLLLLLLLCTVFVLSDLYSSHGFGAATAGGEAVVQSRLEPEEGDNGLNNVPAENNVARQQIPAPPEISLPSSANSTPPAVSTPSTAADQTGDQSVVGGIGVEEKCDMSMGKWVRDPRGPLYTNLTCPTLPDMRNCQKYGKDPGHLFWRWQPDGCNLPRFSPERFLTVVRDKRLAFIGDSLARNQMESLLCLLSQVETPTFVYRDAFDKFVTWHFPGHNFTLMVMWTEFYVDATPVVDADGKATASFDIHLDRVNSKWTSRLPGLDYVVLSGGNWFFRVNYLWEDGRRIGCVNCREAWADQPESSCVGQCREARLTDFGIAYAVRRVVKLALQAIAACKDCKRSLITFLRTYTPDHFEHGSWYSGGYCNRTRPLEEEEISLASAGWEVRSVQREEVRLARETMGSNRFGVLDVTKAMMLRADGHIGAHYISVHHDKKWLRNASDCLHWCLPGPIDMWNGMLFQRLAEISLPPVVR